MFKLVQGYEMPYEMLKVLHYQDKVITDSQAYGENAVVPLQAHNANSGEIDMLLNGSIRRPVITHLIVTILGGSNLLVLCGWSNDCGGCLEDGSMLHFE